MHYLQCDSTCFRTVSNICYCTVCYVTLPVFSLSLISVFALSKMSLNLYSHCPSLHFRNSLLPKKHSVKLLNHHPVQQYMWRCANHTKPNQILPCFLQYSLEMQQSCNLVAEIFATATWELRKIGQGSVCLPYLLQRANCIYKTFKKISF